MKIHVAAPAVIGCQVKHHAHSVDGAFRHVHLSKISLDEIHLAGFDELTDILGSSAAQIVDHSNDCAPCHERIDQIGAMKEAPPVTRALRFFQSMMISPQS